MLERSDQAPNSWGIEHSEAAVREFVLERAPDVICYQELPGLVPFVETHVMIPANPTSHNGNLATLVTHELAEAERPTHAVVKGCALLTVFGPHDLTVANVHLAPGRGSADERLHQISQIVEATATGRLVLVGDTNTRLNEADDYATMGLAGTKPPSVTWDSRRNRFHEKMPEFSAYFTRWFAGGPVEVGNVKVWNTPREHNSRSFHLSDHFALTGTITPQDL